MDTKMKILKSPLLAVLLRKTKTKNSISRLKLAGEPSQRASQQPLFPTRGEGGIPLPPIIFAQVCAGKLFPPEPGF